MVDDLYKDSDDFIKGKLYNKFKSNLPDTIENLNKRISALETKFDNYPFKPLEENIIFKWMEKKIKELEKKFNDLYDERKTEMNGFRVKITELEKKQDLTKTIVLKHRVDIDTVSGDLEAVENSIEDHRGIMNGHIDLYNQHTKKITELEKKLEDLRGLMKEQWDYNALMENKIIDTINKNKELSEKIDNCITHAELEGNLQALSEENHKLEAVLREYFEKHDLKYYANKIGTEDRQTEEIEKEKEHECYDCELWNKDINGDRGACEYLNEVTSRKFGCNNFKEKEKEPKYTQEDYLAGNVPADSVKGMITVGYNRGFKEALGIKKSYWCCGIEYSNLEDYIDARERETKKVVITAFILKLVDIKSHGLMNCEITNKGRFTRYINNIINYYEEELKK